MIDRSPNTLQMDILIDNVGGFWIPTSYLYQKTEKKPLEWYKPPHNPTINKYFDPKYGHIYSITSENNLYCQVVTSTSLWKKKQRERMRDRSIKFSA